MANSKTEGRITIGGVGVAGLKVFAYDQEYFLGIPTYSSRLGTASTNNEGRYSISYEAEQYGSSLDEDRIETSPGSIWPPRLPTYGPGNPDLFIRVFQGDAQLGTSDVQNNVSADSCTINLDLPPDPESERNIFEQIGDAFVGVLATGLNLASNIVEGLSEAAGEAVDVVFGQGSGDGARQAGRRLTGLLRAGREALTEEWDQRTNRNVSMPDDLWAACQERYRNYKRDLLLRHFLPPDRTDKRYRGERCIPFIVSGNNQIGKRESNTAPSCDPKHRYEGAELDPLSPLSKAANASEAWTNDQWREHLRQQGDVYCRIYENGLAYNGSFIACLAYEYVLADSSPYRDEYREECENLITLALDGIEDLERRSGMPGYILRYHEDGDCAEYQPVGDALFDLPPGEAIDLDFFSVSTTIRDRLHLTQGAFVLKPGQRRNTWIIVDDTVMYIVQRTQDDPVRLVVYRGRQRSCGFDGGYCLPLSGDRPTGEEWEKEQRQRKYEPSGDEYVHLLEGLAVGYWLLPASSATRLRILGLLSRIHDYLVAHYYYLIRPCGNFTLRGPYTPVYEFPFSRLFEWTLGGLRSDMSSVSKKEILRCAGLASESEIHVDDPSLMVVENVLRPLPLQTRFSLFFVEALVSDIELPGGLVNVLIDTLIAADPEHGQELRTALDQLPVNERGQPFVPAPVPVWTLWMLAKACLMDRGASTPEDSVLADIYRTWFDVVGDRQFRTVRGALGHSYNPVTLATAVALLGRKTNAVWRNLRVFFDRNPSACKTVETESFVQDGSIRVSASEPEFPIEHIKMEIRHEADILHRLDGTVSAEKPRAMGGESMGEHSLIQCMWPIATIAYTTGRPLNAAIRDMTEEPGMPTRANLHAQLQDAMAHRS